MGTSHDRRYDVTDVTGTPSDCGRRSFHSRGTALAWLERASFDVLVVDMNMPGMGGVEVMQAARQHRPDLAIIVLTGHATLESAIAAVKSEAVDYLLKPVSVHDLKTAVNKALQDGCGANFCVHGSVLLPAAARGCTRLTVGATTARVGQAGSLPYRTAPGVATRMYRKLPACAVAAGDSIPGGRNGCTRLGPMRCYAKT